MRGSSTTAHRVIPILCRDCPDFIQIELDSDGNVTLSYHRPTVKDVLTGYNIILTSFERSLKHSKFKVVVTTHGNPERWKVWKYTP